MNSMSLGGTRRRLRTRAALDKGTCLVRFVGVAWGAGPEPVMMDSYVVTQIVEGPTGGSDVQYLLSSPYVKLFTHL